MKLERLRHGFEVFGGLNGPKLGLLGWSFF